VHAERSVGEQAGEALEVLGRGRRHDERAAGAFAGGSGGRGDAAPVLDERCRDVRCVVDEVEHRVEAVGVLVAHGGGQVTVAGQQLADAERAQVGLVLGECGRDDGGAGAGGELDGEAADAAGRADDQDRVAVGKFERLVAMIATMPASGAAFIAQVSVVSVADGRSGPDEAGVAELVEQEGGDVDARPCERAVLESELLEPDPARA
jgi:hypothetical protein